MDESYSNSYLCLLLSDISRREYAIESSSDGELPLYPSIQPHPSTTPNIISFPSFHSTPCENANSKSSNRSSRNADPCMHAETNRATDHFCAVVIYNLPKSNAMSCHADLSPMQQKRLCFISAQNRKEGRGEKRESEKGFPAHDGPVILS